MNEFDGAADVPVIVGRGAVEAAEAAVEVVGFPAPAKKLPGPADAAAGALEPASLGAAEAGLLAAGWPKSIEPEAPGAGVGAAVGLVADAADAFALAPSALPKRFELPPERAGVAAGAVALVAEFTLPVAAGVDAEAPPRLKGEEEDDDGAAPNRLEDFWLPSWGPLDGLEAPVPNGKPAGVDVVAADGAAGLAAVENRFEAGVVD
jgi:hypothetical protein